MDDMGSKRPNIAFKASPELIDRVERAAAVECIEG
jgi:hypothetical protein